MSNQDSPTPPAPAEVCERLKQLTEVHKRKLRSYQFHNWINEEQAIIDTLTAALLLIEQGEKERERLAELLAVARCPACDGSGVLVTGGREVEYVSRDMAVDAGDPSLEGSIYRESEPEISQCQWCHEKSALLAARAQPTPESK